MILISNHFFLDFDFDFMFLFKIIFINESGTHCSNLSRSRRPMPQLGRCCLSRTEYSTSSQTEIDFMREYDMAMQTVTSTLGVLYDVIRH